MNWLKTLTFAGWAAGAVAFLWWVAQGQWKMAIGITAVFSVLRLLPQRVGHILTGVVLFGGLVALGLALWYW